VLGRPFQFERAPALAYAAMARSRGAMRGHVNPRDIFQLRPRSLADASAWSGGSIHGPGRGYHTHLKLETLRLHMHVEPDGWRAAVRGNRLVLTSMLPSALLAMFIRRLLEVESGLVTLVMEHLLAARVDNILQHGNAPGSSHLRIGLGAGASWLGGAMCWTSTCGPLGAACACHNSSGGHRRTPRLRATCTARRPVSATLRSANVAPALAAAGASPKKGTGVCI
jgi:hypothetical protein